LLKQSYKKNQKIPFVIIQQVVVLAADNF